jgi:hypothetical protein
MPTMDWTLHAKDIEIDARDGFIALKQFKIGQIIEHTEVQQSWSIVDVREKWLKVKPLFKQYEGDPCLNVRFDRFTVDIAFNNNWWRIRRKG